jgi:uncharacterized protein (TIGR02231 family)
MISTATVCSMALGVVVATGFAQSPASLEPTVTDVSAPVRAVVVYPGRAAITRQAELTLDAGLHDLRFLQLPETIQSSTIQARLRGEARVLEVQYSEQPAAQFSTPETVALDVEIERHRARLAELEQQAALIDMQENFLRQVGVRAAADTTDVGGTDRLDLDAVREQLEFLTTEQSKLLQQRSDYQRAHRDLTEALRVAEARRQAIAGSSQMMRLATVSLSVPAPGDIGVDLTYLVAGANWQPAYNIRAAADGSAVEIEYDGMLTQRTGEDWNDVQLSLSTAQPMLAANPPTITPWIIDVQDRRATATPAPRSAVEPSDLAFPWQRGRGAGDDLGLAEAVMAGQGSAVSYVLPSRATVKSNVRQQQRSRITTVTTTAEFVHVATPLLTEAVYIRGELTNASEYLLLPGEASIYAGHDYIGPTYFAGVGAGGTFDLYFGIDPAVRATRQIISEKTSKTGLLGGGLKTSFDYRIEIDNGAGKGLMLELWDRQPIARNSQITIDLVGLTHALATDAEYVEELKPQGLLKWRLGVPASAQGQAALMIGFGVRINRAKNIDLTGLSE